jgi:uncharacterized ion transporter superfamily protein YfcC
MGIWILNLIVALLLPTFMIIYCNIYRNKAPKDINGSNGYKTAMSRMNRDTWEFANHYFNKLMRIAGWILLVLSFITMLFAMGKDDHTMSNFSIGLMLAQLVVLLVSIIPTEKALRKTFDEDGQRK